MTRAYASASARGASGGFPGPASPDAATTERDPGNALRTSPAAANARAREGPAADDPRGHPRAAPAIDAERPALPRSPRASRSSHEPTKRRPWAIKRPTRTVQHAGPAERDDERTTAAEGGGGGCRGSPDAPPPTARPSPRPFLTLPPPPSARPAPHSPPHPAPTAEPRRRGRRARRATPVASTATRPRKPYAAQTHASTRGDVRRLWPPARGRARGGAAVARARRGRGMRGRGGCAGGSPRGAQRPRTARRDRNTANRRRA